MKVTGAYVYVVEQLLETLPEKKNFKVFSDNWFSSVSLCLALKKRMVTAVLRNDQTKQCPLPVEKDLRMGEPAMYTVLMLTARSQ